MLENHEKEESLTKMSNKGMYSLIQEASAIANECRDKINPKKTNK